MYNVRLKPSFTGPSRRRAGLELFPKQTLTVELTKDQLALLKADPEFIVEKAPKSKAKETPEAPVEVVEEAPEVDETPEAPVEVESE